MCYINLIFTTLEYNASWLKMAGSTTATYTKGLYIPSIVFVTRSVYRRWKLEKLKETKRTWAKEKRKVTHRVGLISIPEIHSLINLNLTESKPTANTSYPKAASRLTWDCSSSTFSSSSSSSSSSSNLICGHYRDFEIMITSKYICLSDTIFNNCSTVVYLVFTWLCSQKSWSHTCWVDHM